MQINVYIVFPESFGKHLIADVFDVAGRKVDFDIRLNGIPEVDDEREIDVGYSGVVASYARSE